MIQRLPFFYGWVIVGVAFIGSGIGSGVGIWGASVFILPMTEDLGWSRTSFFAALTIRSVVMATVSPWVGPWLDTRLGPRILTVAGALILGVSLASIRVVSEPWQFWLLFGGLGGLAEIGSGFTISQAIVPKWFVRKRGRALGIATMGTGLGALIFPGGVALLVGLLGWRDAWLVFGLIIVAIKVPLMLLVRTRPEDVGLLPDGAPAPPAGAGPGAEPPPLEHSLTRREALRTPAFWMLLAAFGATGLGIIGFQSSWVPYLRESGFGNAEAALGVSIYGALSGLSRPVWGLLGERFATRHLLAAMSIVTAASILLLLNVRTMPMLAAYMTIAGVVMGGYIILRSLITADYFGRGHLGAVTSMMRPVTMGTAAVSPLLFGMLYDLRGNYVAAFLVALAAWLVAGLVVLAARPPIKPLMDTDVHRWRP